MWQEAVAVLVKMIKEQRTFVLHTGAGWGLANRASQRTLPHLPRPGTTATHTHTRARGRTRVHTQRTDARPPSIYLCSPAAAAF